MMLFVSKTEFEGKTQTASSEREITVCFRSKTLCQKGLWEREKASQFEVSERVWDTWTGQRENLRLSEDSFARD